MDIHSLLLYPFSAAAIPAILYFEKFHPNYKIDTVLLPPAYYHLGNMVGMVTNRPEVVHDTSKEENFEELITKSGGVIILQYPVGGNKHIKKNSLRFIEIALKLGKKVFCTMILDLPQQRNYEMLAKENTGEFCYCVHNELLDEEIQEPTEQIRSFDNFPFIIFVGGALDTTYDLEVTLSLVYHLRQAGINVTGVTTGRSGKLFDLHSVDFLNAQSEKKFTIEWIAKWFRYAIAKDIVSEKPDIVVVQMSAPLVKYSNLIPNGYGIMTYVYNSVVPPDLLISSLPIQHSKTNIANEINSYLKRVYGYGVDCFFNSNLLVDWVVSNQAGVLCAMYEAFKPVQMNVDSSYTYNLLDSLQMEEYIQTIISRFSKV